MVPSGGASTTCVTTTCATPLHRSARQRDAAGRVGGAPGAQQAGRRPKRKSLASSSSLLSWNAFATLGGRASGPTRRPDAFRFTSRSAAIAGLLISCDCSRLHACGSVGSQQISKHLVVSLNQKAAVSGRAAAVRPLLLRTRSGRSIIEDFCFALSSCLQVLFSSGRVRVPV
jgi:hypothetical protein